MDNTKYAFLYSLLLLLFLNALPTSLIAKEVVLQPGESYRAADVTIRCEDRESSTPLKTTDCQFWDDYDKRCLYERMVYTAHGIECIEECQHWDSFNKRCDYATGCTYFPDQKAFVRTTCLEYDSFGQRCLRTKEEKIVAPRRR